MAKKRIKIIAVCGHGQGSSLVLRMQLENIVTDMGLNAMLETTSVAEAAGQVRFADVVLTTESLAKIIDVPEGTPIITVTNLLNVDEIVNKIMPVVREHYPEALSEK
jgi:PTS system ascorbate-specific IIB component